MKTLATQRLLTLALSMVVLAVFGVWLSNTGFSLVDFALHATLESSGSLLMLLLALFIFKFDNEHYRFTGFHAAALAFISMGILNLFHAGSDNEHYFIWPHALSTLIGAVLLLAALIPERNLSARNYFGLPIATAMVSTLIALALFNTSSILPTSVINEHFSSSILRLYNLATLLYLISASYFAWRFWQQQHCEDFYLTIVILLLAVAAFLFHVATLWQVGWWFWHGIKLIAFFVILIYFTSMLNTKNQQFTAREVESSIIKYSVDAIITKSLDNTILTWNAAAEKLFGYTAEAAIGQSITMLYPRQWEQQEAQISQQLLAGQVFTQFETVF